MRSSTCASAASIFPSRTARRSISACRPSGSAKRPNSAPRAARKAQEIRARADRDVTVLLAEATSQSENLRGQGDAERNRIFADAYGKDTNFFSFYRTMQAYERSMQRNDTHLVLRPELRFLQVLRRSKRQGPVGGCSRARRGGGSGSKPAARKQRQQVARPRRATDPPMSDFIVALGLFFALEGIVLAAFPSGAKRMMTTVLDTPDGPLRIAGIVSALVGLFIVWLVRG